MKYKKYIVLYIIKRKAKGFVNMELFCKKAEPVVVKTTQEVIDDAVNRLSADITDLTLMKNDALSSFRITANTLGGINETLKDKVDKLQSLILFATGEKDNVEKMISDNEAVRQKIIDIIGD